MSIGPQRLQISEVLICALFAKVRGMRPLAESFPSCTPATFKHTVRSLAQMRTALNEQVSPGARKTLTTAAKACMTRRSSKWELTTKETTKPLPKTAFLLTRPHRRLNYRGRGLGERQVLPQKVVKVIIKRPPFHAAVAGQ